MKYNKKNEDCRMNIIKCLREIIQALEMHGLPDRQTDREAGEKKRRAEEKENKNDQI